MIGVMVIKKDNKYSLSEGVELYEKLIGKH